jgi:hypothetical protein
MRFDLVQPLLELCAARLHKSGLATSSMVTFCRYLPVFDLKTDMLFNSSRTTLLVISSFGAVFNFALTA